MFPLVLVWTDWVHTAPICLPRLPSSLLFLALSLTLNLTQDNMCVYMCVCVCVCETVCVYKALRYIKICGLLQQIHITQWGLGPVT